MDLRCNYSIEHGSENWDTNETDKKDLQNKLDKVFFYGTEYETLNLGWDVNEK